MSCKIIFTAHFLKFWKPYFSKTHNPQGHSKNALIFQVYYLQIYVKNTYEYNLKKQRCMIKQLC